MCFIYKENDIEHINIFKIFCSGIAMQIAIKNLFLGIAIQIAIKNLFFLLYFYFYFIDNLCYLQ